MPDLAHSLQGHDLGHLRIVAERWGLELNAPDARSALGQLPKLLLDKPLVDEIVEALPPEARAALSTLQGAGGRMPWSQFLRRFGEVREMGPGRRDRLKPHRHPASISEALWYRALVARAFFDAPGGPQEFAYIPDDLLPLLPASESHDPTLLGRPAAPAERAHLILANDRILDHACTLLAALRLGLAEAELDTHLADPAPPRPSLEALLSTARILGPQGDPLPEAVRAFLEAPRPVALAQLAAAWLGSEEYNDLHLIPYLQAEGEWSNHPSAARQKVLSFLGALPPQEWWSLDAFVADVKQHHPDFQRPAGDFESWYLRDLRTGQYLRGFHHWDAVDGTLLRHLITGPLHWLGFIDLAAPQEDSPPRAFRFSPWSSSLLAGQPPSGLRTEEAPLHVSAKAELLVPPLTPRAVRYQLARFCEWDGFSKGNYRYHLTAASLARAERQNLRIPHLLALLQPHAAASLPPNLVRAFKHWQQHAAQARIEQVSVLRVNTPEVLQALRGTPAARFLGDPLGPTSVVVKPGAWRKVIDALTELGFLAELRQEDG